VLRQAGFHWELRRNGELKIGLWRKELRKRKSGDKSLTPKRLVLTPGFGDTPLSWLVVISILNPVLKQAKFDEIILVDFPGFNGFMSTEKSFHSMDLLMGALGDVLDSLMPDTILGHSLGGWLVSRYAVECGQGVRPKVQKRHGYRGPRAIMLVSPSGVHESKELRAEFEALFRKLVRGEGVEVIRKRLFAREPFWFRFIEQDFRRFTADEGIFQFTESVREDHLVQEHLQDVKAETWLIWGAVDTLVPTAGVQTWLDGLSATNAHAVLLNGVGHSPQVEKPAVTAAVLAQILLGRKPHERGNRWWKVLSGRSAA
jgi:pimeloyl-ACP methyl ester carboxylesterase